TMLQDWQQTSNGGSLQDQILNRIRTEIATHSSDLLSAIPAASLKALTVASNAIYLVIIPILAFFFLKDANAIKRHILELVENGPRRELLEDVMADASLLLAHYMRALVSLSLGAFTAYSLFFLIAGVPYGFLLAALAGLLEFIPMLGPLTAGIAILVVAGVTGSHVLGVLIFLLAYRLFQDYVFSPHLMGHGVELHPLLVLFGVFAGTEIAGIAGTILSVPVLALGRVIYVRIQKTRLSSRPTPQTPFLR
ncbi:MAG TPA: AI-2E family transporter, partial [Rhizomicrobium sp.]